MRRRLVRAPRRRFLPAVLVLLLPGFGSGAAQAAKKSAVERKAAVASGGLTETAGISLTLLDVEVVDEQGRPIRGLTKDDFTVTLNWLPYPVYSVDDFCTCPDSETGRSQGTSESAPDGSRRGGADAKGGRSPDPDHTGSEGGSAGSAGSNTAAGRDIVRYILYLDFGQLQAGGRFVALSQAKRWIREIKRADDEVMIAAFSREEGPKEITDFTRDTDALAAALERAGSDPALLDPFPAEIGERVEECEESIRVCLREGHCELPTDICVAHAQQEYWHSQASLLGLKAMLTRLGEIAGRKALVWFNQNGTLVPSELYPETAEKTGDLERLLNGLAAEAALSRTAIYAASVQGRKDVVNLGLNLADLTGGRYNRGSGDLPAMIDSARRDCACVYRIGLEPPKSARTGKVYSASVEVRGRRVERSFRVLFLDDLDRWVRAAAGVLRNPGKASELDVGAAVIPVRRANGSWDVSIEVAIDLDAITTVRSARGAAEGAWEAGALLSNASGANTWEMLGVSSLRRTGTGKSDKAVLHRSALSSIPPGEYRLAAFIRDKTATVFGGAQALLDLPPASEDGIAGPVVMLAGRSYLPAPLPRSKKGAPSSTVTASFENGPIPAFRRPFVSGDPVALVSWICPAGKSPSPPRLLRSIAREGVSGAIQLEAPALEAAGQCYKLLDTIRTTGLEPGHYAYQLEWERAGNRSPLTANAAFQLVAHD